MATDPAVTERNALLDQLTDALEDWYEKETKAIQDEADFVRNVVKGRQGAMKLSKGNVEKAKVLVIDDITSFLVGL
jgi:orotate phosphoribosyltransferase